MTTGEQPGLPKLLEAVEEIKAHNANRTSDIIREDLTESESTLSVLAIHSAMESAS